MMPCWASRMMRVVVPMVGDGVMEDDEFKDDRLEDDGGISVKCLSSSSEMTVMGIAEW